MIFPILITRKRELTQLSSFSSFSVDLSTKEGIQAASSRLRETESHIDILVSNAGIRRDPSIPCNPLTASLSELQTSLLSSTYDDWLSSFKINTMAHYFLSVSLLDLLVAGGERKMPDGRKGRDHGCGVVVVTSSIASLHNATNVDMMSYASTKAATDHLIRLLSAKFARWYVRVCGINPGCKFLSKLSLLSCFLLVIQEQVEIPAHVAIGMREYCPVSCDIIADRV